MSNRLPLNDTDFWWLRYGLGVAVPVAFTAAGIYSIITRHSYFLTRSSLRGIWLGLIPIRGEQAILMGVALLGVALALFANNYAQYHDKMGWYYQWPLGAGMVMVAVGIGWCSCLFLTF